jgi:hypothetical protein
MGVHVTLSSMFNLKDLVDTSVSEEYIASIFRVGYKTISWPRRHAHELQQIRDLHIKSSDYL